LETHWSSQGNLASEEFRSLFRHHPSGAALITANGPAGPVAMTATSVTSISADPPLIIFSVSDQSSSAPAIKTASSLVVHLLDARHVHLGELGAKSGINRFEDEALWRILPTGEPVFHDTTWFRCIVRDQLQAGTATVVVAEAIESSAADHSVRDSNGLVYLNRTWRVVGDPVPAPEVATSGAFSAQS
jgi:flavin reductase (DIM6/NTAB) family NADH-FMN oxidoreductase RutF